MAMLAEVNSGVKTLESVRRPKTGQPVTVCICVGTRAEKGHISVGTTAPTWPPGTWLLCWATEARKEACPVRSLTRISAVIDEYNARLGRQKPPAGQNALAVLALKRESAIVRRPDEAAWSFDGNTLEDKEMRLQCEGTYELDRVGAQRDLSSLSVFTNWPDFEKVGRTKPIPRPGRCGEAEVDVLCEEHIHSYINKIT